MTSKTIRTLAVAAALLPGGCAPPAPLPPLGPPPPPIPYLFPHRDVWTAGPGVELRVDSGTVRLPRSFTRLEVLQTDSPSLVVRCVVCPDSATGRVAMDDLVHEPDFPAAAAQGSLAEFALAVRLAAEQRDVMALRRVMAPAFTFSFVGQQGPDEARAAWAAEGYTALDRVPALLDQGLSTGDSLLWVAPPEYLERLDYRGLRLGFRRSAAGAWEWVFLIRSENGGN